MSNVLQLFSSRKSAAGTDDVAAPDMDDVRARLVVAVRKCCPRWLAGDVEDLAQEAMIRVLKRQQALGEPMRLTWTYLSKVAYSAVVDEIRARRRRPEGHSVDVPDDELPVDDAAPPADPGLSDAISGCLLTLGEDRRRALTLHLMGHSVPEAAQLLQWPAKRVENLVYRGLAALRQCLQAKGFAP